MIWKVLKYLGIGFLALVVLVVAAVAFLPSTLSQMAANMILDDLGIDHTGTETIEIDWLESTLALGPVTVLGGENPLKAKTVELELTPSEFTEGRVRVNRLQLDGIAVSVKRLEDGDTEINGTRLSELLGPPGEEEPEQEPQADDEPSDPLGIGVDILEISNSNIFLEDINGGEFEIFVEDLKLEQLETWDEQNKARLTLVGKFNDINLNYDVTFSLFSDPMVIDLAGKISELTLAKIARTSGEPMEVDVAGTIRTDSKYRVLIHENGTLEAASDGVITLEGLGIDTPDGKVSVPMAELKLNTTSKGGENVQPSVQGDIELAVDQIVLNGPGGEDLVVNALKAGGTELHIVDIRKGDAQTVVNSVISRLEQQSAAKTGLVELLLQFGVMAAEEIAARNLEIEGHPFVSVGEVRAATPGDQASGVPAIIASLASADIKAVDFSAKSEESLWTLDGTIEVGLTQFANETELPDQKLTAALATMALKLADIEVETDGAKSSLAFGLNFEATGIESATEGEQALTVGSISLVSPGVTATGGDDHEERAFGELKLAINDVGGKWPDAAGTLTLAGGSLAVDLADLDLQKLVSEGGGVVKLTDWNVRQEGTPLKAGFAALTIDVPSARIITEDGAITVEPGGSAAAPVQTPAPPASAPPDQSGAPREAEQQPAEKEDEQTQTAAEPKNLAETEPAVEAQPAETQPAETQPEAEQAPKPAPVRMVNGIPVPPVKPGSGDSGGTAVAAKSEPEKDDGAADVREKPDPVKVAAPLEPLKALAAGAFDVTIDQFVAAFPSKTSAGEISGEKTHLALQEFGVSSAEGGTAKIIGGLSFTGWKFSDAGAGIEASLGDMRATTSGVDAVFGKGFSLIGAADTRLQNAKAALPGGEGQRLNMDVASLGANMETLDISEGRIKVGGKFAVRRLNLNQAGENQKLGLTVGSVNATMPSLSVAGEEIAAAISVAVAGLNASQTIDGAESTVAINSVNANVPAIKMSGGGQIAGSADVDVGGLEASHPMDGRTWSLGVNTVKTGVQNVNINGDEIGLAANVAVDGINVAESGEAGQKVAVDGVRADGITMEGERITIDALNIDNLQAALTHRLLDQGKDGAGKQPEKTADPAEEAAGDGSIAPVRIGNFVVSPGSAVTMSNKVGQQMVDIEVLVDKLTVKPIDLSNAATMSDIDIALQINRSGKITVKGNMPPLAPESGLNMAVRASNIQTKDFSPFTKDAVGVGIKGGTAAAAIDAKGDPKALNGNANIVLRQIALEPMSDAEKKAFTDQFTFSPEYILDILSDSDGVIDLNVPISGTTADPDFDISGIAAKAVGGMATSALSSPFSTVGSIAGGAVGAVGGAAGAVGGLVTGGDSSAKTEKDAATSADSAAADGKKAGPTEEEKAAAAKAAQEAKAKDALEDSFGALGDSLFGN